MAGLKFTFEADVKKLQQTREEIEKLVRAIEKMPSNSPQFKVLNAQLNELEKGYKELGTLLSKVKLMAQEASKAEGLINQTRKQTEETNKATDSFKAEADSLATLEQQSKKLTKEWLSMSEAQRKGESGQSVANEIATVNAQRKIEVDGLRALQKEYVNTQKVQNLQEGSIRALRAQLSNLNAVYDSLSRSQRTGTYGKELVTNIQAVTKELSEAEQASMRFQRNVGNYASGWNGLNVQVQQVARELPSLAIGANTFFLAISNNLPMLADELKKARIEYKALKEEGKAATPVWKQVISSLFSWQTALVAGVTILSLYGKEIVSWAGSLFTAKKVLSETYQSLEDYQKKVGETSGSIISTLERLSQGWKRLGGDINAQKKFIIDNKDAINSMGVSVTNAAEAERAFNSGKGAFILGILQRAKAAAAMELASEEYKKAVQKMMEADARAQKPTTGDKLKSWFVSSFKGEDTSGTLQKADLSPEAFAKDKEAKLRKEADNLMKSGTQLIQKYSQFSESERKTLQSIGIKATETMIDGSVEAIEATINLKQEALKKVTDPKDYRRIEAEIKAEQSKLKAITGEKEKFNVSNYIDSYGQSREVEKSNQAIKEAITKSEFSIQQQQIDLMDDGNKKYLAQIRLNYDKRYQEIHKEEQELLLKLQDEERKQWEKDNPHYKKKNLQFTPTATLPSTVNDLVQKEYSLAYEKMLKEQSTFNQKSTEAWNEYYIKYGQYQEKRKAITEKYDKQLAKSESGSAEEATLIAQRKEELDGLDKELMDSSKLWGDFFSDFSNRSSSAIRDLIGDIQELIDYMNGVEGAKMPDMFKDSESTVKAINDAMSNPTALNKFTSALSGQVTKFNKMLDKDNPFKLIQDGFKNNDLESTSKGFQGIASAVQELGSVMEDLGVKSDSTAGKVTSVLGNTASYAAKGASIGGPWGAVIGGAIGMATGLVGVLGADYSAYNKMKDEYGNLIDVWDTLIDRKKKYIDIDYGNEARKAGDEAIDLLNKKSQSNVALGIERLNSGASGGSHSIGVRQRKGMSSEGWSELEGWANGNDISNSLYSSIKDGRMTGLFNLTAEQLETLQEQAPTFWAKLDDDVKDYLQGIIDCNDEIEEMKESLKETLNGVSFDSFYDNFVSLLSDMDNDSEDFAENFGEYLKTAILSNIVAEKYRSKIQALYDQWASYSDSNGDGNYDLTSEETQALKDAQQKLADEMIAERDSLANAFGWDSSSSSQDSTSNGYETMSQDTGEELNGRFTALQIAGEEIKQQNIKQTGLLSSIDEKMTLLDYADKTSQDTSISTSSYKGADEPLSTPDVPDIATKTKEAISNIYQPQINVSFPDAKIDALTNEVINLKYIVDDMRTIQAEDSLNSQEIAEYTKVLSKNTPKIINHLEDVNNNTKRL